MNRSPSQPKPWATNEKDLAATKPPVDLASRVQGFVQRFGVTLRTMGFYQYGFVSLISAGAAGAAVTLLAQGFFPTTSARVFVIFMVVVAVIVANVYLLKQVGFASGKMMPMYGNEPLVRVGIRVARGEIKIEEGKHRALPAPELALLQFVQQVRAYATEKSFARTKEVTKPNAASGKLEQADLLRRRWDEVLDSLGEFEIYLANDPQGVVDKLSAKYPIQVIDVSQVFRDVAEGFDNTWRRKGINLETAIVTPLKAKTNEALLRRLLVGPWRASAYFARRGHGVVFSAKSEQGRVRARWECDGLHIPQPYLDIALNTELPANERIERGMTELAVDSMSPNTLNALISLVTWIDLAKASNLDFKFKHTNDGFVIELTLESR